MTKPLFPPQCIYSSHYVICADWERGDHPGSFCAGAAAENPAAQRTATAEEETSCRGQARAGAQRGQPERHHPEAGMWARMCSGSRRSRLIHLGPELSVSLPSVHKQSPSFNLQASAKTGFVFTALHWSLSVGLNTANTTVCVCFHQSLCVFSILCVCVNIFSASGGDETKRCDRAPKAEEDHDAGGERRESEVCVPVCMCKRRQHI